MNYFLTSIFYNVSFDAKIVLDWSVDQELLIAEGIDFNYVAKRAIAETNPHFPWIAPKLLSLLAST